jgi:transposase
MRFRSRSPQPKAMTPSQKAAAKSKAFLRKTQFQLYKQQGLSDGEAARRVGIKIPFGRRFNIIDIMKKINEGQ